MQWLYIFGMPFTTWRSYFEYATGSSAIAGFVEMATADWNTLYALVIPNLQAGIELYDKLVENEVSKDLPFFRVFQWWSTAAKVYLGVLMEVCSQCKFFQRFWNYYNTKQMADGHWERVYPYKDGKDFLYVSDLYDVKHLMYWF
jgi:hypothetical protein